ncbi:hypothetical protein SLEP1_g58556 [Rubroshorea leprosula]|uniref:SAUR-like auxin-responsive protein family n=1 Tax=Rubroshorea leprosula TaxID=152421 RepID=A0AAV5MR73_9ROSI|nr:hypothetical protein SLEP1_g58556 [Rubroshorea leprosula]
MIGSKKLIAIVRKWQKIPCIGRRPILLPGTDRGERPPSKGHFVVYTMDERRFLFPLAYLRTNIFQELFRLSEEEFGLPRDGPITLPCDAASMEKVVSLVRRPVPKKL